MEIPDNGGQAWLLYNKYIAHAISLDIDKSNNTIALILGEPSESNEDKIIWRMILKFKTAKDAHDLKEILGEIEEQLISYEEIDNLKIKINTKPDESGR